MDTTDIKLSIDSSRRLDRQVLEWFAEYLGETTSPAFTVGTLVPQFRTAMRERGRWNHTLMDALKLVQHHRLRLLPDIIAAAEAYQDAICDIRERQDQTQSYPPPAPVPEATPEETPE